MKFQHLQKPSNLKLIITRSKYQNFPCFPCLHEFEYLLNFLSYRSLLITSFHVSLSRLLRKLQLAFKILYWLDQSLISILSIWTNHCSLLSCKHSFMLFNFILVLSSSAEISSSDLTLHIHLTILAPFLSILITSSSLFDQVSMTKRLLTNKDTKSLNLHHPLLILVTKLSNAPRPADPPLAPIILPRY